MKIRLLQDCEGPNPAFDPRQPPDDLNPHTITIPAGTEIEDAQAWLLCVPNAEGETLAEPIDAEAQRRVAYDTRQRSRLRTAAQALAETQEAAAVAAEQGAARRTALADAARPVALIDGDEVPLRQPIADAP